VLSETNEAGALYVADRLKHVVTEAAMPHPASPLSDYVTVCLGIATAEPTLEFAWEDLELLAAAGKALVLARQTGRDAVALSIAGCAPAHTEARTTVVQPSVPDSRAGAGVGRASLRVEE
jgi:hypothetical protein